MRLRRRRPALPAAPPNPRLDEMVNVARQVRDLAGRLIVVAQQVREEVSNEPTDREPPAPH